MLEPKNKPLNNNDKINIQVNTNTNHWKFYYEVYK